MPKRITISDVAEQAGVSTGTVSAVLNDRSGVRETTRARVRHVMAELGYRPSTSARHLAGLGDAAAVQPPGVGVVIKEIDNPFYAEVVKGAGQALDERGYVSLVCTSEGDYEREGTAIDSLRNRFVGGVIIAPVLDAHADLSHLFMLRRSGFPFVLLETVLGLPTNAVSVDNVEAAALAVRHLLGLGHERVVHFAGPTYTRHSQDRSLGFERAVGQSPLPFTPSLVVPAGSGFEDGYRTGLEYFRDRAHDRPTAVTCFNDLVALGLIRALTELGLRVPDDVSVVGFDDIPAASYLPAPLTTVHVPQREMGRRAATLLLDAMADASAEPTSILLDASLVERATTAPPA
ncbi:LacI family DNA-binding transcriptional regulator [Rubrivirga marina]|uniref:LacI family transcriptional regulator n=1 Tax=Rubrivirga marina TaxID=1196024 RepID=A0A271IZX7_9BACT|nr:LacI family DNA-binding transcriptional regulator [Rubrivirga marina]PAP76049.1 LacI family transcriptional regulator [Rubrivirga marina]